jgi:hypothetical protein
MDGRHHRGKTRGLLREPQDVKRTNADAENVLERALSQGFSDLHCRFNFLTGLTDTNHNDAVRNVTVDLVRADAKDREIAEFIELKAFGKTGAGEHPFAATIQLAMYYLLFRRASAYDPCLPRCSGSIELTILGPEAYYAEWTKRAHVDDYSEVQAWLQNTARGMTESLRGQIDGGDKPEVKYKMVTLRPLKLDDLQALRGA